MPDLPDLNSDDEDDVQIIWKFGEHGPEFDVFNQQSASNVLSKMYTKNND